jgi:hypothetical protein
MHFPNTDPKLAEANALRHDVCFISNIPYNKVIIIASMIQKLQQMK